MRTSKACTGLRARFACHRRWSAYGNHLPSHTRGGSRMRESRTYGSVRGARGNSRPYREGGIVAAPATSPLPRWSSRLRVVLGGEFNRSTQHPSLEHTDCWCRSNFSIKGQTLDTALVPSSGSGVIRQYWQLFQPSQRFAFSCSMNRVRACPSICMPFQRGGLE